MPGGPQLVFQFSGEHHTLVVDAPRLVISRSARRAPSERSPGARRQRWPLDAASRASDPTRETPCRGTMPVQRTLPTYDLSGFA